MVAFCCYPQLHTEALHRTDLQGHAANQIRFPVYPQKLLHATLAVSPLHFLHRTQLPLFNSKSENPCAAPAIIRFWTRLLLFCVATDSSLHSLWRLFLFTTPGPGCATIPKFCAPWFSLIPSYGRDRVTTDLVKNKRQFISNQLDICCSDYRVVNSSFGHAG